MYRQLTHLNKHQYTRIQMGEILLVSLMSMNISQNIRSQIKKEKIFSEGLSEGGF